MRIDTPLNSLCLYILRTPLFPLLSIWRSLPLCRCLLNSFSLNKIIHYISINNSLILPPNSIFISSKYSFMNNKISCRSQCFLMIHLLMKNSVVFFLLLPLSSLWINHFSIFLFFKTPGKFHWLLLPSLIFFLFYKQILQIMMTHQVFCIFHIIIWRPLFLILQWGMTVLQLAVSAFMLWSLCCLSLFLELKKKRVSDVCDLSFRW